MKDRQLTVFVVFVLCSALAILSLLGIWQSEVTPLPPARPKPSEYDNLLSTIRVSRAARIFYSIGNGAFSMARTTWKCPTGYAMHRMGPPFEGGKWVCFPQQINNDSCLIYSWGSNDDFGFEEGIHGMLPSCEIHTFDCTVEPHHKPEYVQFHHWCLGRHGTYLQLLQKLNHVDKKPLMVKMDIEGWEWPFFQEYFNDTKNIPRIRQLIVEIHLRPPMELSARYKSIDGFVPEVQDDQGRRTLPMLHLFKDWDKEFEIVAQEHNTNRSPPAPGGQVGCATCAEFTLMAKS